MRATIAFNRPISEAYRHLGLCTPGFPATFQAGRFVMVRALGREEPFLPRAFSIYRLRHGNSPPIVEILYKVLGKGTQQLARMEPSQAVEVLGPLGNAFTTPDNGATPVLVAGGIGVPPIAALAEQIQKSKNKNQNTKVFLGGKTFEDILCVKDFEEAGAAVQITTENGSLGARGLVTDILRPFLITHHASRITIYTCGPPGMLATVARLSEELSLPCEVSVEANMACGFGACMGCAIEVKDPAQTYKLVCIDGPVFDAREIVW